MKKDEKNTLSIINFEQDKNNQTNIDCIPQEIALLKKLLFKIWGVTEILQSDINYIRRIYSKPKQPKKIGLNREERIAKLKHKLITSGRKRG